MKKITFITSFFDSPYHTDRAPYNEQLFKALSKSYDVNIVRPIAWTDIVSSSKCGMATDSWYSDRISYPIYVYPPMILGKAYGVLYFLSLIPSMLRRNGVPDLIYTTWAYPDAYGAMLVARLFRRPYIVRVHGSDINVLAARRGVRQKIVRVLCGAVKIISPSNDLKNKMIKLGVPSDRIEVIYSGVDLDRFRPMDRLAAETQLSLLPKKRIIYVGNFKAAKGVFDFVGAMRILQQKGVQFEAMMIGKGEAEEDIRREIDHAGLTANVHIVGAVSHSMLPVWINAADCVCLPSYSEGVPNVLLEAMACGTNIVATKVGGIPEIVQHPEVCLVDPGDIREIAERIEHVIQADDFITTPSIPLEKYESLGKRIGDIIDDACDS
jgi:glycosyltransferase involved in cell wall biosynthesis